MKRKHSNKDLTDVQAVECIADALIAHVAEAQNHVVDPFEEYVFGVEAKIFSKKNDFKKRCLSGLRALLKSVESEPAS